jgi:phosphomannomutase/phosphoglucomutase
MKINPQIFRAYDIRGFVDKDLTEDAYEALGRAYATWLQKRRIGETAVGRDNRLSSERFAAAFIRGVNAGGVDTVDIGLSLSQIVYFSSYELKTKAAAMVTASHNPKEFNGLKLGTSYSETMLSDDLAEIREIVETENYSTGSGLNRSLDIFPAYLQSVTKHFALKKRWKVVVDACNTTSGKFYPAVLREAGCEVVEQNTNLDGDFPLGVPDPTEVKVLERLADGVRAANADIGFAYDTDGDRMAVVDEQGNVLWMDTIVSLFAQDVLDYLPGAPIVYNSLCSRQVTEAIEKAGGRPVMERTGHSFIKSRIRQENAPFGGELSGHIFFMDNYFGHDDGAYASLRLLQYLERTDQPLSQAVATLAHYISSPEIKLGMPDHLKFDFINTSVRSAFKESWPDAEFVDIDGIRMDYADRMATIRASQNGPYITVKFEAKSQEMYDQLKVELREMLRSYSDVDWSHGVNTEALD